MGTWGEGPFENDQAADMVAKLMKPIRRVVESKRNDPYHYGEARAAAEFVLASHGTDILGGPPVELVVQALVRMRADEEWLAEWTEPADIARALDQQINSAMKRIQACKQHRKKEIRELQKLVAESPRPIPKSVYGKGAARRRRATAARNRRTTAARTRRAPAN